jgi:hypothetical protein
MSHDPHDDDRHTKMEPLHGPVVLALVLFGGLAYWLLTREAHPPHEASPPKPPASHSTGGR